MHVPKPDNISVRTCTIAKWSFFAIVCLGWYLLFWDVVAPDLQTYAEWTHSNATYFMATAISSLVALGCDSLLRFRRQGKFLLPIGLGLR